MAWDPPTCWRNWRGARGFRAIGKRPPADSTRVTRKRVAYHHVQIGWSVVAGSAVGFAVALVVTLSLSASTLAAAPWLVVALFGLLALGLLTYATLTIDVDD